MRHCLPAGESPVRPRPVPPVGSESRMRRREAGCEAGRSERTGCVMEPRNLFESRSPTLCMHRKARSTYGQGRCPGRDRRGLRAEHVLKGETRELGRAAPFHTKQRDARAPAEQSTESKCRAIRGTATRRIDERPCGIQVRGNEGPGDDGAAIGVVHSTDEAGEVRPKRASGGKGRPVTMDRFWETWTALEANNP